MQFCADLHIHSKFSIATSKNLDFENLYQAAQLKGLTVVGTGDCTHPGWLAEMEAGLEPAETGLYRLKPDTARIIDATVPEACRSTVRFLLQGEISCIYKKDGRTRKNHNLVFLPDLECAQKFSRRLAKIGNIGSDGRPILGLDARNLLELLLETSPEAFLIPAHIWTPWFSLLGSKSGFDALEECFDDLSTHIFAVETGLSSDPAMNWQVSGLDGLRLVSNSDAHSPLKLAREANHFDTALSYPAIKAALQNDDDPGFIGTMEFYPEEGKYHLDGHRKCAVRWEPQQTLAANGICPVCAKPLTLGVLNRVNALADRTDGSRPSVHRPFQRIIPLEDILAEIFQVGAKSKRVQKYLQQAFERLGGEIDILLNRSLEELNTAGIELLGEAVARMRRNQVTILPGYDGEFGKVQIFSATDRQRLTGQRTLFQVGIFGETPETDAKVSPPPKGLDHRPARKALVPTQPRPTHQTSPTPSSLRPEKTPAEVTPIKLNAAQQAAVDHGPGPLMIVAGPGTGKTRTLTQRMGALIGNKGIEGTKMVAVTFTNKAAGEMAERLQRLMADGVALPWIGTFHALGHHILKSQAIDLDYGKWADWTLVDDALQQQLVAEAHRQLHPQPDMQLPKVGAAAQGIMSAKQQLLAPNQCPPLFDQDSHQKGFQHIYQRYQELLAWQHLLDFEDLIGIVIRVLETDPVAAQRLRARWPYFFIDEYQDINYGQYRLIRLLTAPDSSICVIGDPDQSIYGFRGSDSTYFYRFKQDYPNARVVHLNRNYRSTPTILTAAGQTLPVSDPQISSLGAPIPDSSNVKTASENSSETLTGIATGSLWSDIAGPVSIGLLESATPRGEAVAVGKTIEALMGGMDLHAIDQGRVAAHPDASGPYNPGGGDIRDGELSFGDFAVLYRIGEQSRIIADVFTKAGIPWRVASRKQLLDHPILNCLVALLKLIENQGTLWDVIRCAPSLSPRLSAGTLDILKSWSFDQKLDIQATLHNARRFPIPALGRQRQRQLNLWIESLADLQKELGAQPLAAKLDLLVQRLGLVGEIENKDGDEQLGEGFHFMKEVAIQAEADRDAFFTRLALNQDPDLLTMPAEKVTLMTMHGAKGLEFPVVFVVGCEDGLIPFKREDPDDWSEAEERRLLYVAMTRARWRLYLSWARQRTIHGRRNPRLISPFLGDIDPRILQPATTGRIRPRKQRQLQLF